MVTPVSADSYVKSAGSYLGKAGKEVGHAGGQLGKATQAVWHSGNLGKASLIGAGVLTAHFAYSAVKKKGRHELALEQARTQQQPGMNL